MHDYIKKKYNNMNCNYDCDESPSLSSNDCLMKDVTVLICSSVDGLSIFVSFTSRFKILVNSSIGQHRMIPLFSHQAGTRDHSDFVVVVRSVRFTCPKRKLFNVHTKYKTTLTTSGPFMFVNALKDVNIDWMDFFIAIGRIN